MNIKLCLLLFLAIVTLCLFSCGSRLITKDISMMENSIELYLFPVGAFQDLRYSIVLDEETIKTYSSKTIKSNERKLHSREIGNINDLVSKIQNPYQNTIQGISDTWGCLLKIDDEIIYMDDDFSFETPPEEIKNLISYLTEISSIKIKLYGFS